MKRIALLALSSVFFVGSVCVSSVFAPPGHPKLHSTQTGNSAIKQSNDDTQIEGRVSAAKHNCVRNHAAPGCPH